MFVLLNKKVVALVNWTNAIDFNRSLTTKSQIISEGENSWVGWQGWLSRGVGYAEVEYEGFYCIYIFNNYKM